MVKGAQILFKSPIFNRGQFEAGQINSKGKKITQKLRICETISISDTTFIFGKEYKTSCDKVEDVSQVVGGVLGDDADVIVG